jgi:hypothetical protein
LEQQVLAIPYTSQASGYTFADLDATISRSFFQKIPALETLHLSVFLDDEENGHTHQAAKVHLQHLQQLHVNCAVPEMAQFLPNLIVPRSSKLHIHTGNDYDQICDEFRAILSWLSNQHRVPTKSLPTSSTSEASIYIMMQTGWISKSDFAMFCRTNSWELRR